MAAAPMFSPLALLKRLAELECIDARGAVPVTATLGALRTEIAPDARLLVFDVPLRGAYDTNAVTYGAFKTTTPLGAATRHLLCLLLEYIMRTRGRLGKVGGKSYAPVVAFIEFIPFADAASVHPVEWVAQKHFAAYRLLVFQNLPTATFEHFLDQRFSLIPDDELLPALRERAKRLSFAARALEDTDTARDELLRELHEVRQTILRVPHEFNFVSHGINEIDMAFVERETGGGCRISLESLRAYEKDVAVYQGESGLPARLLRSTGGALQRFTAATFDNAYIFRETAHPLAPSGHFSMEASAARIHNLFGSRVSATYRDAARYKAVVKGQYAALVLSPLAFYVPNDSLGPAVFFTSLFAPLYLVDAFVVPHSTGHPSQLRLLQAFLYADTLGPCVVPASAPNDFDSLHYTDLVALFMPLQAHQFANTAANAQVAAGFDRELRDTEVAILQALEAGSVPDVSIAEREAAFARARAECEGLAASQRPLINWAAVHERLVSAYGNGGYMDTAGAPDVLTNGNVRLHVASLTFDGARARNMSLFKAYAALPGVLRPRGAQRYALAAKSMFMRAWNASSDVSLAYGGIIKWIGAETAARQPERFYISMAPAVAREAAGNVDSSAGPATPMEALRYWLQTQFYSAFSIYRDPALALRMQWCMYSTFGLHPSSSLSLVVVSPRAAGTSCALQTMAMIYDPLGTTVTTSNLRFAAPLMPLVQLWMQRIVDASRRNRQPTTDISNANSAQLFDEAGGADGDKGEQAGRKVVRKKGSAVKAKRGLAQGAALEASLQNCGAHVGLVNRMSAFGSAQSRFMTMVVTTSADKAHKRGSAGDLSLLPLGMERYIDCVPRETRGRALPEAALHASRSLAAQAAMLQAMIYSGCVPEVDMWSVQQFVHRYAEAQKPFSQCDATQPMNRLVRAAEIAAILTAIATVQNAADPVEPSVAELYDRLLLTRPFLVATDEHAVFAASLAHFELQQVDVYRIFKALSAKMMRKYCENHAGYYVLCCGQGTGPGHVYDFIVAELSSEIVLSSDVVHFLCERLCSQVYVPCWLANSNTSYCSMLHNDFVRAEFARALPMVDSMRAIAAGTHPALAALAKPLGLGRDEFLQAQRESTAARYRVVREIDFTAYSLVVRDCADLWAGLLAAGKNAATAAGSMRALWPTEKEVYPSYDNDVSALMLKVFPLTKKTGAELLEMYFAADMIVVDTAPATPDEFISGRADALELLKLTWHFQAACLVDPHDIDMCARYLPKAPIVPPLFVCEMSEHRDTAIKIVEWRRSGQSIPVPDWNAAQSAAVDAPAPNSRCGRKDRAERALLMAKSYIDNLAPTSELFARCVRETQHRHSKPARYALADNAPDSPAYCGHLSIDAGNSAGLTVAHVKQETGESALGSQVGVVRHQLPGYDSCADAPSDAPPYDYFRSSPISRTMECTADTITAALDRRITESGIPRASAAFELARRRAGTYAVAAQE